MGEVLYLKISNNLILFKLNSNLNLLISKDD